MNNTTINYRPSGAPDKGVSYKSASRWPKGGAVAADKNQSQAHAAEAHGLHYSINPETVFAWAQKHGVDLIGDAQRLRKDSLASAYILGDKAPPWKAGIKRGPLVRGEYNRNGYIIWINDRLEYSAGNHAKDSTQTAQRDDERLPLRVLRSFCIKQVRGAAQDCGGRCGGVERVEEEE